MERQKSQQEIEEYALIESIAVHGILVPIVVDEKDSIIDGVRRMRVASLLELPLKDVPFDVRRDLTENQKLALCIALNSHRQQNKDYTPEFYRQRDELPKQWEMIQEMRLAMKVSQADLAFATGIDLKQLEWYERGVYQLSLLDVYKLTQYLRSFNKE